MREVKVFVSSPGDLRSERQLAKTVISELNTESIASGRFKFTPYLYEDHTPPLVGNNPQTIVNQQMIRSSEADIVICMLWWKYGTPLPPEIGTNKYTGRPFGSGTENEFYEALVAQKRRRLQFWRRQKPAILLYRKTLDQHPVLSGPDPKVTEFFTNIEQSWKVTSKDTRTEGIYESFRTEEEFHQKLAKNLEQIAEYWNRPTQRLINEVFRPAFPILLVLAVGFLLVLATLLKPLPLPIGAFNIAVAGFTVASDSEISQQEAAILSEAFFNNLQIRLEGMRDELPLIPSVWGPSQLPRVQGSTAEERAQHAQDLISHLKSEQNAPVDLLIYGEITTVGNDTVVVPEFYLPDTSADTSELVGRYRLTEALVTRTDPRALSGQLSNRSEILAAVTQGIVQMIVQDYDAAYRAFTAIIDIDPTASGIEMLYLLRANASLMKYNKLALSNSTRDVTEKEQLLSRAESDLTTAISLNEEYSRAFVALGSILYLHAIADFAPEQTATQIPDGTLEQIEEMYNLALDATDRPDSADIPAKVTLGLGQVQLLRCLQGETESCGNADVLFAEAIAEYTQRGNARFKEQAAQAYSFRGVIARIQGDYSSARVFYEEATKITSFPYREEVFRRALMDIDFEDARAGRDWEAAAKAYTEVISGERVLPNGTAVSTSITGIEAASRLYQLGKLYSEVGQDQQAISMYQRAIDQDLIAFPKVAASLHIALGDKYFDIGDIQLSTQSYETALEFLEQILAKLNPQSANYGEITGMIDNVSQLIEENRELATQAVGE